MSVYLATKAWVDDMVKRVCKQLSNHSNMRNESRIVLLQEYAPKFLEGNYCPKKRACNVCNVSKDLFCNEAPKYFFINERFYNNIAFKSAREFAMEDDCILKYGGLFFLTELLECGAIEQLNAKIGCDNFSIEVNKIYCGPIHAIRYAPDCPEIDGQTEYIYVKEKIEIILKKNNI